MDDIRKDLDLACIEADKILSDQVDIEMSTKVRLGETDDCLVLSGLGLLDESAEKGTPIFPCHFPLHVTFIMSTELWD